MYYLTITFPPDLAQDPSKRRQPIFFYFKNNNNRVKYLSQ